MKYFVYLRLSHVVGTQGRDVVDDNTPVPTKVRLTWTRCEYKIFTPVSVNCNCARCLLPPLAAADDVHAIANNTKRLWG